MGRKKILLACCIASLLLMAACASDAKTGRTPQTLSQQAKDTLSEQIERSADQPLRVAVNEEPPLKIVEATVKVISGPQFTALTGAAIDFADISSVPEVKLVNISGKTITAFSLILRNPKLRAGRTILQRKVSVAPGETYLFKRDHFLTPGKAPAGGGDTEGGRPAGLPGMESEQYWLTFAERSDLFITVGRVSFDDGSGWLIKEGGEVR